MGAVIDHVEAWATEGQHGESNFATACNKCNARKNSRQTAAYLREKPAKPVRGKFGEPKDWDGLVSLFLVLGAQEPMLTPSERAWERELKAYLATRPARAVEQGVGADEWRPG
jgi:hypothetical protein